MDNKLKELEKKNEEPLLQMAKTKFETLIAQQQGDTNVAPNPGSGDLTTANNNNENSTAQGKTIRTIRNIDGNE